MGVVARQHECLCQVHELQRRLLHMHVRSKPPARSTGGGGDRDFEFVEAPGRFGAHSNVCAGQRQDALAGGCTSRRNAGQEECGIERGQSSTARYGVGDRVHGGVRPG